MAGIEVNQDCNTVCSSYGRSCLDGDWGVHDSHTMREALTAAVGDEVWFISQDIHCEHLYDSGDNHSHIEPIVCAGAEKGRGSQSSNCSTWANCVYSNFSANESDAGHSHCNATSGDGLRLCKCE